MHSASCFQFHILKAKHSGSPNTMGLHLPPNFLRWIQLRTIRRQQVQSKPPLKATDLCRHLARLVHWVPVQNQKDPSRAALHQALQKAADNFSVQFVLLHHKSHLSTPIHRTQQIQPVTSTRRTHHRSFPLHPPRRPRMIITAKARFISKPNLRPHPLGFASNRRIFLLNPLTHSLRILLVGPPKRLLGSNPQLGQQATHRILAQPNLELPINQNRNRLARPQGKWKSVLAGIAAHNHSVNPGNHRTFQLPPPPSTSGSVQGVPTAGTIHRQPVVDASPTKTHGANNIFGAFPTLYSSDCTLTQLRKHFMLQFPAIHSFHGQIIPIYSANVYTIMDRLVN